MLQQRSAGALMIARRYSPRYLAERRRDKCRCGHRPTAARANPDGTASPALRAALAAVVSGELRGKCRQPSKKQRAGQYHGVRWDKKSRTWQASISAGDSRTAGGRPRQQHLGYYDGPTVAASAYDLVARAAFGETALCNPIPARSR